MLARGTVWSHATAELNLSPVDVSLHHARRHARGLA
jgi:hypothetical protein